jgi:alpha-glucosidase
VTGGDTGRMPASDAAWWQQGVIYQIYPRSFQDSDGDGIGDLRGILSRLEYLQWLGVRAIWIAPLFPSPMADFGYDISDYNGIDPCFGSLADMDLLIAKCHAAGIRVILDYVPNHTSHLHPWFQASRADRVNAKRHWYVWRDPAPGGGPPNNWLSEFGGSAWTLDPLTQQYYYHAYLPQQPDLNWREPEVERAMHSVLRFWLERGIDGFRVDAIHMLIEDDTLQDNPPDPNWRVGMSPARKLIREHTSDRPQTHEFVARMRKVLDEYCDRVLIAEAYLPIDRLVLYYGVGLSGFHLPFNFHLISTPWDPLAIAKHVREYEAALPTGGWPNWVLGNHDKSRVATRLGTQQARLAALLLFTLRGTPTLYNGDEIGMHDVPIPPEQIRDPWEKRSPGLGLGRDPCRTPFQWSAQTHSGFSNGTPWLPVAEDFAVNNMEGQRGRPGSLLTLHRALIELRENEPALATGSYREIAVGDGHFVFERASADGKRMLVGLNFTAQPLQITAGVECCLIFSSAAMPPDREVTAQFTLLPFEGIILRPR